MEPALRSISHQRYPFPEEESRHGVLPYIRFTLSLRDVREFPDPARRQGRLPDHPMLDADDRPAVRV